MMTFRRAFLPALLSAMLLASACSFTSPPPPTPQPSEPFVPAPAAEAQKVKIAVCSTWSKGSFDAIQKKLNDAIAAAGQNAEFEIQYIQYQDGKDYNELYLDKVKAELAAGAPTADAYLLGIVYSQKLFEAGSTMEMTELVQQNAPVYCSKYGSLFLEKLTGIPVGIFNRPMWAKAALMLRQDFASAGGGITTVEGLFSFIDETIVKPKKKYVVLAYEADLVIQWALDKGYYDLQNFGLNGFLFCGVNDKSFTPVPLEDIPGFADFIIAMKGLRLAGILQYPFESEEERDCIAFVYYLSNYYYPSPYVNVPIAKGQFTAQLLSPDQPGYFSAPTYANEFTVPAVCDKAKAAEVARFVEWMYSSQDNYDSIVYGEKGVDFADKTGRYTPLIAGKPLSGNGYKQIDGLFFTWPAATDISNSDYYRMPSAVPSGVEELVADGLKQNRKLPLAERITMDKSTIGKLQKLGEDIKTVSAQRNDALNRLVQSDPATFTKESFESQLESVRSLKNKWLCEQYAAVIKGLLDGSK